MIFKSTYLVACWSLDGWYIATLDLSVVILPCCGSHQSIGPLTDKRKLPASIVSMHSRLNTSPKRYKEIGPNPFSPPDSRVPHPRPRRAVPHPERPSPPRTRTPIGSRPRSGGRERGEHSDDLPAHQSERGSCAIRIDSVDADTDALHQWQSGLQTSALPGFFPPVLLPGPDPQASRR